jgi:hypothetical protein
MNTHSAIVGYLNGLETHLLFKGQNHVISRVCSVLERGQLGLQPAGNRSVLSCFSGRPGWGRRN